MVWEGDFSFLNFSVSRCGVVERFSTQVEAVERNYGILRFNFDFHRLHLAEMLPVNELL